MGRMKELWQDQQDHAEPCPTDFKTKKEWNEFNKTYSAKKKKKRVNNSFDLKHDRSVPMSINSPGDNAAAWLDDEPWRKW